LLAIVATGIGVAILIVAYWLPTILAKRRRVRGLGQVAIVNGLLGWTVIGWIVALVMAYRDRTPGQHRAAPGRPEGFIA
jgi:hypothetical protein